jgi:hypothetical protein
MVGILKELGNCKYKNKVEGWIFGRGKKRPPMRDKGGDYPLIGLFNTS